MSMIVAPDTPTLPLEVVAEAPLKVTVQKLANGTRELPDSKSSTIHSALVSQSLLDSPLKVWVTVLPVETFSMTAEPAPVLDAVTVILMVFPAEMLMPEKS